MQQFIYFFQKYRYFLFFVTLEIVALVLIINNHNFHKSKFISSANGVTGGAFEVFSNLTDYFNLKDQNKRLVDENERLKNIVSKYQSIENPTPSQQVIDTVQYKQTYTYTQAKIIRYSYHLPNNYLTINKGSTSGISKEMAVINSKGIIGITENITSQYARVQSILNSNSKINARLKNSNHFGSLEWNGVAYNTLQLHDIPRQALIKLGDTIITDGKSTIFPEGLLIGSISHIERKNNKNLISVQLFNDMSSLGQVYVISNLNKQEINSLNNFTDE